ncbi:hypothetical protein JGU66_12120 [Myxococcaceae bacterium JPH2]|nr:hypothetical protein [Myxococcaceae bacterium JPH2]
MSRVDGGNRPPSSSRRPETERPERGDVSREKKPEAPAARPTGAKSQAPTGAKSQAPTGAQSKEVMSNQTMRPFQGRSDFEPARPTARPTPPARPAISPADAESIAQADAELGLLEEFPDQDAQGGLASAMLHAHSDAPVSQNRIVERLKQDGRLEALFGEVFRDGNPYVEQPHRKAIVRALDTAMERGTVTTDDIKAFARGAYAQEWREIGAALGGTAQPAKVK